MSPETAMRRRRSARPLDPLPLPGRVAATCGLLLALLAPDAVAAQPQAAETLAAEGAEAAPEVEPILPEEGLLRPETWVSLFDQLLAKTVDYAPRLFAALIVFLVFWILSGVARRLIRTVVGRTKASPALVNILSRLARYTILILGGIMAISQAGFAVGPLLASVSVLGLAVGLAAQDSLSNLVAGLTILWDRPFSLGDRVTLDDTYGEVTDISIRTTTVRTPSHRELIIPNQEVITNTIINHSRTTDLRLDIALGIGYGEDFDEARRVLIEAAEGSDHTDPERPVKVVMTELADSSVNLELRVWIKDPHKEKPAGFDLLERAKKALDGAGIEIPFPQRVLHLESSPAEPLPLHVVRAERFEA
ncbi:MAG: mechanosensitive ion channel family protein [Acidobacteria bacterium]|nr:MAG: mechanosensitive ion channel family protein [Acidobacteriota bacterium]REK08719.1 MAG: mechanosensitive ion channel family protein [Acidobacteriota bacterium]